MHKRISVNNLSFPKTSLGEDIMAWRKMGAQTIGLFAMKLAAHGWEDSIDLIAEAGLAVATFTHPFLAGRTVGERSAWTEARTEMDRTIRAAERLGSPTIYMTTGGRGPLDWQEAAAAFAEAVAPCVARAADAGVQLLVEPANPLYADLHFIHSLVDTVRLARLSRLGVCVDVFSCWTEAGLLETIADAAPITHLVQVSDYVLSDRALSCRAVPGDGAIPLGAILSAILDGGYQGAFDLELLGPRIEAEGAYEAAERAARWVEQFLVSSGRA